MKLSQHGIKKVQAQIQAEPMPDDHPALSHLKTYIGDHTFYIGSGGVFIWEYADGDGEEEGRINALRVATWADSQKRIITLHRPQITETVINISRETGIEKSVLEDIFAKARNDLDKGSVDSND